MQKCSFPHTGLWVWLSLASSIVCDSLSVRGCAVITLFLCRASPGVIINAVALPEAPSALSILHLWLEIVYLFLPFPRARGRASVLRASVARAVRGGGASNWDLLDINQKSFLIGDGKSPSNLSQLWFYHPQWVMDQNTRAGWWIDRNRRSKVSDLSDLKLCALMPLTWHH